MKIMTVYRGMLEIILLILPVYMLLMDVAWAGMVLLGLGYGWSVQRLGRWASRPVAVPDPEARDLKAIRDFLRWAVEERGILEGGWFGEMKTNKKDYRYDIDLRVTDLPDEADHRRPTDPGKH